MAYLAPYIDAAGLHIPSYQDIEDYLVLQAQDIFGADIYLAEDSQDFQFIAALAQLHYDTMLAVQVAYNNRSPVSAIAAALDGLVALNGIQRNSETFSTATVTLTGTAFAVISNGVVADSNGKLWSLPASVTLGAGGSASVTATCQTRGAITALAGQLTVIMTPTSGWTSVTNASAASPGQPEESDSALKGRQAVSVSNPSQALTTGILGEVLAVPGVISAQLYENDGGSAVGTINGVPNPGNYPAHSITLVVNGGSNEGIASAVALRKTPGCSTQGDQTVTVVDQFGVPTSINFYRPTQVTLDITVTILRLTGYSSAIGANLKTAVLNYINGLVAGQSVRISQIEKAALSAVTNDKVPQFDIPSGGVLMAVHAGTQVASDIIMNYNQQAVTVLANITLNET
jgi:uncharacterized phage protein gp47/JayE